jgi:endoglucanase
VLQVCALTLGALAVMVRRTDPARPPAVVAVGDPQAARFLGRHVSSDGRVVRSDQGGDIVSEGEAYAMVIAEAAHRPDVVRTVWSWTRRHLQRSDGLLSWHADGSGHVLDSQSAADADTLAAFALVRYDGPGAATLHGDGDRLAAAVLAHETVMPGGRAWALAAGPWAMAAPATVDPSYLMPPIFRALADATGHGQWRRLADNSVRLVAGLTHNGAGLPPDWARVNGDRLIAVPAPGHGGPVQYGPDAARVPVWFAVDPSTAARSLAARWRSLVQGPVHVAAVSLHTDGAVLDGSRTPLSLVASAAMARAAGDAGSCSRLLRAAIAQSAASPSYYGDAWAALGHALLTQTWRIGP